MSQSAAAPRPFDSIWIGGVRIDDLSSDEALTWIDGVIKERVPRRMLVTNASKTILAQSDVELREILSEADLVTADGMSVVWAARLLGTRLRERVTGIDTMCRLVAQASKKGYSVYFLGAKAHVVKATVDHFLALYPELKIAGWHDGYFDQASSDMAEAIRQSAPDVLFVALGSPAQEKWMVRNQERIGVPFCLGVGGSFDHVAGFAKRAPRWLQRAGLEWLFRLLSEPGRLWKRYLVGNSKFIWLVLKQLLLGRSERIRTRKTKKAE